MKLKAKGHLQVFSNMHHYSYRPSSLDGSWNHKARTEFQMLAILENIEQHKKTLKRKELSNVCDHWAEASVTESSKEMAIDDILLSASSVKGVSLWPDRFGDLYVLATLLGDLWPLNLFNWGLWWLRVMEEASDFKTRFGVIPAEENLIWE